MRHECAGGGKPVAERMLELAPVLATQKHMPRREVMAVALSLTGNDMRRI
jgi:hypothetical protein